MQDHTMLPAGRSRGVGLKFIDALPDDGERRLMLAVLLDAIRTVAKPGSNLGQVASNRASLRERAWLQANDETQPFSFVSICHALGLDAGYVRRRVLHPSPSARGPARRYAMTVAASWLRVGAPYSSSTRFERQARRTR